ncbi:MAG: hypothetical protein AB8F74_19730 [Saprospiraceae bacterium]
MSDLKNLKDELEEFSPELLRMKKENGFQVPPRYFDKLGDDIMRSIRLEEQATVKEKESWFAPVIIFFQTLMQPRYAVGFAAVALLLIGIQQFGNFETTSNDLATASIETLSDDAINSYLSDNILEFEEELLEELAVDMSFIPETIGDEELNEFLDELGGEIDLENSEEQIL